MLLVGVFAVDEEIEILVLSPPPSVPGESGKVFSEAVSILRLATILYTRQCEFTAAFSN
jgi:hypothetical protein